MLEIASVRSRLRFDIQSVLKIYSARYTLQIFSTGSEYRNAAIDTHGTRNGVS